MRTHRTLGVFGALCAMAWLLAPAAAFAHADQPPSPQDLWSTWTVDASVTLPLAAFVVLYSAGLFRLARRSASIWRTQRWRFASFAAGLAALLVALVSPLDGLGDSLFSAHMGQHMILMLVAAPLLVLAVPLPILLLGLPRGVRRPLVGATARHRMWRRATAWLVSPWVVAIIQLAVLWGWHAPPLFRAAQADEGVHTLMHLSFFGAAVLFWWAVITAASKPGSAALRAVAPTLVTMKFSSFLGVFLLYAHQPIYPEIYAGTAAAWGTTALEDQQRAALVMLAPGAVVYFLTAVALMAIWLQRLEKASAHYAPLGSPGMPRLPVDWDRPA